MHILASCPDKIARLLWERYFSKNENTAPLLQELKQIFTSYVIGYCV